MEENPDVVVYMPDSFPQSIKGEAKMAGARLIKVRSSTEICKGACSTGELGDWIKEQSLVIRTAKELVVITGCAHPGVVNVIEKAKEIFNDSVYLVLGGFHLCRMTARQIKEIIKGVKKEKVEKVAPCHCSGDLTRKLFEKAYGKNFILSGAGKRIRIKEAF